MAVLYQLKTFADVVAAIREELQIASTDTVAMNRIKRDVNIVYLDLAAEDRWRWTTGSTTVGLNAYYSNGTASVTTSTNVVTLSIAPGPSKAGYYFALDGYREIYRIESHTAGSVTVRLNSEWTGTTQSGATFKIWTDRIPLPSDCKETILVRHDHYSPPLESVGLQEFRKIANTSARAEGKPSYCTTGDYVDPGATSAISSLPNVSTRASAGVVKTLVFVSAIPTSIVTSVGNGEPVKWRISASGNHTYNGDITISSVSTTALANDTITYTGSGEATESATADSTMVIRALVSDSDNDRYRELLVYPSISTSRVSLHVDYVREVTPLSNDTDEPLMPVEDRAILMYGGLHRGWSRNRNSEEAARNLGLYNSKLTKMQGKLQDSFDKPKLQISKIYMNAKRNVSKTRAASDFGPTAFGGGSAGAVVTGTPSTVATFDSSGNLVGSSTVSLTELNYLDGVSSAVQTQLDAITTLASGKILVGNGSNVATEVTPSGDATISTAGVIDLTAGAIVNADVNAAAAIAHSKMAALTASRAMATDGSGVASVSAVTATELAYLSGVTSAIQTQFSGIIAVSGTRAAPNAIVAGTGVANINATARIQFQFIQGSGGAVDVSANPQIAAGAFVGQVLVLIGRDDTNTVTLEDGTGLSQNGPFSMGADDVIAYLWDGTNHVEIFRREN